jgi:hypothetical protein
MTLESQVTALLTRAAGSYPELGARLDRMADPLRVVVAGKPRTGKNTLRNALADSPYEVSVGDPEDADAVVYLMRHVHATDVDSLAAFQQQSPLRMNTIGVLARADEIGAGRLDAMTSARQIARRYAADARLRGLCQTVLPVAGLLAQTARSLRKQEFEALAELAAMPRDEVDARLLSADRLLPVSGALLDRFGMYGIRLGVTLVRQGCATEADLAGELARRSGLTDLLEQLDDHFAQRAHLLKARSGLIFLNAFLATRPEPELRAEVERLLASAHEFAEVRLLDALRAGRVEVPADLRAEAERLLGADGAAPALRLGLTGDDPARPVALAALGDWRRHAENPLSSRQFARAAQVIVRTCEGMLAGLG